MAEPGRPVAYLRSDAILLAALVIRGGPERLPATLADLLLDVEFLNKWLPSFDEVSFGVPRLVAGGFAERVPGETATLLLRPSPAATALLHLPRQSADFAADVALALGTRPYPEDEAEDRSLGRVAGLARSEFDREVQVRQSWQQKLSPRGRALFETVFAEQIAANGAPVSGWKPRKKRSRAPGDRGVQ